MTRPAAVLSSGQAENSGCLIIVEFIRVLNKVEKEMWELEAKGETTTPEYYRLTGERTMGIRLKEFYEKEFAAHLDECHGIKKTEVPDVKVNQESTD